MSGTKHWLMTLQGLPEYKLGWEVYEAKQRRESNPIARARGHFDNYLAWYQGWDDAKYDEYMESINDDPPENT